MRDFCLCYHSTFLQQLVGVLISLIQKMAVSVFLNQFLYQDGKVSLYSILHQPGAVLLHIDFYFLQFLLGDDELVVDNN